ncbi:MAG: hypothetical protein FD138_4070 [Planctomycetota bacterium]|nr:MAG: hypothetical protein FD138_4070 [Planctomycetota bacterium]
MPSWTIRGTLIATMLLANVLVASVSSSAADTDSLLKVIKAVGREGQGNREAKQAVSELSQQDAATLPAVLMGFRDANPLAANYLRGAVETIADRALKSNKKLPIESLEPATGV